MEIGNGAGTIIIYQTACFSRMEDAPNGRLKLAAEWQLSAGFGPEPDSLQSAPKPSFGYLRNCLKAAGVYGGFATTATTNQALFRVGELQVCAAQLGMMPIVRNQTSPCTGQLVMGNSVRRNPNAWPPFAYRCISAGTCAFHNAA